MEPQIFTPSTTPAAPPAPEPSRDGFRPVASRTPIPVMDVMDVQSPRPAQPPATPRPAPTPAAPPQPSPTPPETVLEEVPVAEERLETFTSSPGTAVPSFAGTTAAPPGLTSRMPVTAGAGRPKQTKMAIIIGGVVAIIALSVAAFVYLRVINKDKPAPTNTTNTTTTTEETPATSSDVDATSKALDDSLGGVDDTKDFNEADISDTTLGL